MNNIKKVLDNGCYPYGKNASCQSISLGIWLKIGSRSETGS
jgi:hypothetical protein